VEHHQAAGNAVGILRIQVMASVTRRHRFFDQFSLTLCHFAAQQN
jgi:hypothetical protein